MGGYGRRIQTGRRVMTADRGRREGWTANRRPRTFSRYEVYLSLPIQGGLQTSIAQQRQPLPMALYGLVHYIAKYCYYVVAFSRRHCSIYFQYQDYVIKLHECLVSMFYLCTCYFVSKWGSFL